MTTVLPWSPAIVGNPQNGAVHGGALTTLMDTTCGMATLCVLPRSRCARRWTCASTTCTAEAGKDIYGLPSATESPAT
jgi:acyl-coenzyme A thioesterase PaaI-like protein